VKSTQLIAENLATFSAEHALVPADLWTQYVEAYLLHLVEDPELTLEPGAAAAQIAAHLDLGLTRGEDEDLLRVVTPGNDAAHVASIAGSTVAQLVTTDRPFLVDTIAMEVHRQGWTLRRLEHPQLGVLRDSAGRITRISPDGQSESWLSLEVYPSLGVSAETASAELVDGLRRAIGAVRLVASDRPEIEVRAIEAAKDLAAGAAGTAAAEIASTGELLHWLVGGHFSFMGYQEFDYAGGRFTPRPGTELGIQRETPVSRFHAHPVDDCRLLVMTKYPQRSAVHRPVYLDYVGVRQYDAAGAMVGEKRFLGLLLDSAYAEAIEQIPVLAAKADELLASCSGYPPGSYGWNAVWKTISNYPRDELFEATVAELAPIVQAVASLRDLGLIRTYLRRNPYGEFATALVYVPRDRFTTETGEEISQILLAELGGESIEYTARIDQSVLTRLFFTVKLGPDAPTHVDAAALSGRIEAAVTTWDDEMSDLLAGQPAENRGVDCGRVYPQAYSPRAAIADLAVANTLSGPDDLRYTLEPANGAMRFKIFSHRELELHELLPHLASLGARVDDERPFTWWLRGRVMHLYDFGLRLPDGPDTPDARQRFVDAFDASYRGTCESDQFNKLVLAAELTWSQVVWLRAIGRYLQQAGVGFSQDYLAACLLANPALASGLARAFSAKFDPDQQGDWEGTLAQVSAGVEQVASLDQDRILRMYVAFIQACVRTNAFAAGPEDDDEGALAFKIAAEELELLPRPRPLAEIFVYSPRVSGVHLRFGTVARGGLRWSDRAEDFRTEVLGLVKAQMVKNTVIVPLGAKGGFVPQHLPDPSDRAAWLSEGTACYRIFISALLSVTDNIVDGAVRSPDRVVCHDGDDPYLVVAADKGTASFSDIANEISTRRGFWLADAFASGGSAGYDHKAMGITAAGAWESAERHFAELGIDPQATDFTCVGIGDMSGDVFGNGMLSSEHIRLVAAFDHRHIFLDPDPDPATSFAERTRLFGLPRSGWSDYDPSAISSGGGVFPRSAKTIPISAAAARALGLPGPCDTLSGNDVVSAILRAPVDLLYNGGIGTYVKASGETQERAGDRANDAVRVDGNQVRARCAVEGGNLGWTQAGRVEYARAGGAINTDFIDNSAGVDCSDHEVNIKILLADAIAAGLMPAEDRDQLLASMTDDVAASVLQHNVAQNLALSNAIAQAEDMAGQHAGWMRELEEAGLLDRALEFLPSGAQMKDRMAEGRGLTRPELAVLMAHTKIALTDWVLGTDLPEDPYLADRLTGYFPAPLRERFADLMPRHRLAREIITTVAVNRFVDSQGITAFHRLSAETGAGVADVIRAQLAARAIYSVGSVELLLGRQRGLDAALATRLRLELRRMVERAARWLLQNRRWPLVIGATIAEFAEPVAAVRAVLADALTTRQRAAYQDNVDQWVADGVPAELARELALAAHAHSALGITQVARRLEADPVHVARVHGRLVETLSLDVLDDRVAALPRRVRWDDMARSALRDELLAGRVEITARAFVDARPGQGADPDAVVDAWAAANPGALQHARTIGRVCEGPSDVARMSVGLGALRSILSAR
jgi:glutamate dehydrogenase